MHWNNRVLWDGEEYWVGEVYYQEDCSIYMWTSKESDPVGAWGDFIDLNNCVHYVVGALDKPVLDVRDPKNVKEIDLAGET